jgi:hypothetical protein
MVSHRIIERDCMCSGKLKGKKEKQKSPNVEYTSPLNFKEKVFD